MYKFIYYIIFIYLSEEKEKEEQISRTNRFKLLKNFKTEQILKIE